MPIETIATIRYFMVSPPGENGSTVR
jgi:hypothetical protein